VTAGEKDGGDCPGGGKRVFQEVLGDCFLTLRDQTTCWRCVGHRRLQLLRIERVLQDSRLRGFAALPALLGEDFLESIHGDAVAVVLADVTEDFLAVGI
jgi:hypothetical protein